jgi:hypothetical protein
MFEKAYTLKRINSLKIVVFPQQNSSLEEFLGKQSSQ